MAIIVFSIPFFFLLIALELAYGAATGRRLLRLNDSIADLSCGILSQISGVFSKLFTIAVYIWVADHLALQHWLPALPSWSAENASAFGWVTVFVLVDLCYYWSHRLSHRINLLWAGHVVHHSSEEYNLAVALRQSSLHGFMTWVFYVPLALLGIPWQMYVTTYALNLLYQFWIHTQAVGRLSRWAELVLNTPSHHRVHHGVNPRYLDRNHAGVFIIWDRLFGTFQEEDERAVYGITTPLRSWNPLWANIHVFRDIAAAAAGARNWRERLMYVVGPPGWSASYESSNAAEKYDPQIPAALAWYGFVHFAIVLLAAVLLLRNAEQLPMLQVAAAGFYIAISLAAIAGIFEAAQWATPIEAARLVMIAAVALGLAAAHRLGYAAASATVVACAASLLWFLPRRRFLTETEIAPIM